MNHLNRYYNVDDDSFDSRLTLLPVRIIFFFRLENIRIIVIVVVVQRLMFNDENYQLYSKW